MWGPRSYIQSDVAMHMCNPRMPLTSWEVQSREPQNLRVQLDCHMQSVTNSKETTPQTRLKAGREVKVTFWPPRVHQDTPVPPHTCTNNTHMLKTIPRRFQTKKKRICHLECAISLVWYRMCSNLYRLTLSYLPSARPIEVKTKTKNFHHRPLQVTLFGNSFFFLIYFLKTPYMSIIFTSLSTVLHQSLCWEILQDIIKLHQTKEILICLKKFRCLRNYPNIRKWYCLSNLLSPT